jgi:hypothetical protein
VKILVYLKDGRTVYLLQKRGELARLVGVEPWGEHDSIQAVRGTWNPATGEYVWARAKLRFVNRTSISTVEEVPRGLADAIAQDAPGE